MKHFKISEVCAIHCYNALCRYKDSLMKDLRIINHADEDCRFDFSIEMLKEQIQGVDEAIAEFSYQN